MSESDCCNIECEWKGPANLSVPLSCRRMRELNKSTEKVELRLRHGGVSETIALDGSLIDARELEYDESCVFRGESTLDVGLRVARDPRLVSRVDSLRGVCSVSISSSKPGLSGIHTKDVSDLVRWPEASVARDSFADKGSRPGESSHAKKRDGKIPQPISGISTACNSVRSSPMQSPNGPLRVPVNFPKESTNGARDAGRFPSLQDLQWSLDSSVELSEQFSKGRPKYGIGSI